MTVHVAIVDPLPMFQRGVVAVLSEAGYTVETPADVLAWLHPGRQSLVLLTLESEHDWEVLSKLRDMGAAHAVVALVEDESATAGVRAVRAGARSVLPRRVTTKVLRRTVEATIDGQAVLPLAVAAALVKRVSADIAIPQLIAPEQLSWLRQLAAGITVARLAERTGYSERAMFRLLHSLYREMGVRTRMEAIMRAQEQGWLHAETENPPARSR